MLFRGEIVSSTYFPEMVEIKRCEPIGEFYIIEAVGQESRRLYEILLEEEKLIDFEKISKTIDSKFDTVDIQKYIQYKMLQSEIKFSNARAVGNKNVIPLPHQIEAVYGRMLQVPRVRFLLADDPGAGKTIMAGMLMKELMARYQSERILILVPPLVLRQWQEELEEKFGLHFHIINRNTLREYGRKNPFIENDLVLASMHWAIRDDVKPLIQEADYDLIIVDEAHKMAAYTQGTNKKKVFRTKLYQLGEAILRKAEHVLLLTATPHKGDTENFRHLMKLIDEDVFTSSVVNESLKEKVNPFMIRRLKENLVHFDGTPIFPKRTTKTIQFELTDSELDLYDNVTNYVREYFNKAISDGSQSTAFAMMLLQRRLSSSIQAIYLSLKRRYARLLRLYKQTEEERKKYLRRIKRIESDNYLEESSGEQERIEKILEQSVANIDMKELKKEILVLKGLIKQAERIKLYEEERKYQELEETLFGLEGLLHQGEKIIIFTESVDTLNYLEDKLLKRVPKVAKIVGGLSMDKRREQVELFRNECQIMLATDAGGESINLQFCNQMINYDIPWNPNKLEQRMGRIHRIGQKNEVFVFNLVAKNTREGSVMVKLLDKMEKMRNDLGSDLVYDFIGEVLEDNFESLADLMQQAIIERENLDDLIENMDRTLSEENKKLIDLVREERMVEDSIDLPDLKKKKDAWIVSQIPLRFYSDFTTYSLEKKRVRITKSKDEKQFRIERLPKFIRDEVPELRDDPNESYRYTNSINKATRDMPLIDDTHPLFKTALALMKDEMDGLAKKSYYVTAQIPEDLFIEVFEVEIVDGTGKTLESHIIHLAKRKSGEIITLDGNWIFKFPFMNKASPKELDEGTNFQLEIIENSTAIRDRIIAKRRNQLNKIHTFVEKSFNQQYRETLNRLQQYQRENIDNRNSALINQMDAKLKDLDRKKQQRIDEISRQKNVSLKPPNRILSLEVSAVGNCKRVLASDYFDTIIQHEKSNGRLNVKQYNNLGLVDYSSERFNGEQRFIILTTDEDFTMTEMELEDLQEIKDMVFVYFVEDDKVKKELPLKSIIKFG